MENHFKNKLKNHKVDWNKEELLVGLETSLSEKKKSSRRIWFLLFSVGLIVLLISWAFNLYMSDVSSNTSEISQVISEIELNKNSRESIKDIQDGAEDDSLANNISDIRKESKPASDVVESSDVVQKESDKNKLIFSSNESDHLNNVILTNEYEAQSLDKEKVARNVDHEVASKNNRKLKPQLRNPSSTKQDYSTTSSKNKISLSDIKTVTRQEIELMNIPHIIHLINYNSESEISLSLNMTTAIESAEPKKLSFYVEPNLSLGFLQRKFNNISMDNLEERRTLEKTILHDAVSLEFGTLINQKWAVQFGLEYQEMREKFSYDLILQSDTTFVEVEDAFYFLDEEMDTTFVSGMQPNIFNEVRKVRHYNEHSYINIPLNVSRRFNLNKTFITASVGMSYSIKHNFKGRTKRSTRIIEDERFSLKNKIGFQLGLAAEYSMSDNKQLFVKTIFRKSPTLRFSEISEKSHLSYSLGLGVRFYLDNRSI